MMKICYFSARLAFAMGLFAGVGSASASVLSIAGNDTLVGNRAVNLILNGSFEADGGVAANYAYWATGTALLPTMSLAGWAASGQPGRTSGVESRRSHSARR